MDNLSVHKTLLVRETLRKLNMIPIFNVPYSPDYNGIESYFFLVKQVYKKTLLQRTMKGEALDVRRMIMYAIRKVEDAKTINCVRGGLNRIFDS